MTQLSASAPLQAFGFAVTKRSILPRFLPGAEIEYIHALSQVRAGATLLVWGARALPGLPEGVKVVRVEDGFLRSVGLGAAFATPLSWVFDAQGLYFDSTRASDLETLLQHSEFDEPLCARAAALREKIVSARMTKYNVAGQRWQRPAVRGPVCLVIGQVERDASITFGSPQIRRNADLLAEVRRLRPDAHLLYRPHPDVTHGLRGIGIGEREAQQNCDQVVADADLLDLLAGVDELHVMTSLAGFEALLRGVPVVTHGQPFYSGWGLTDDLVPLVHAGRRTRKLSLDELVAGCLIQYPRYIRASDFQRCSPEQVLDELTTLKGKKQRSALGMLAGKWLHRIGWVR